VEGSGVGAVPKFNRVNTMGACGVVGEVKSSGYFENGAASGEMFVIIINEKG